MKPRIGLLTDTTFAQRPGGANRLVNHLLAAFPKAAYELRFCLPGQIDRTCAGYVLIQTKGFSSEELEFICTGVPFMRYELDYWDNDEPQAAWRPRLNAAARSIAFVSPLHQQVYTYRHQFDLAWEDRPQHVVPCPLNPAAFVAPRWAAADEERTGVIWAGEWAYAKGPDIAAAWAQQHQTTVDFFSPTMKMQETPFNAFTNLCGFMPEAAQPGGELTWYRHFARYDKFIFFPRWPQAFSYTVLEAYLLGLELELTGRIGCESFGGDLDAIITRCAMAGAQFWELAINDLGV